MDEILRIPQNKLLVILRGNKPLQLDKIVYTKHPLANKLNDSSIYDYKPNWTKKAIYNSKTKHVKIVSKKNEKLDWNTF